MIEAKNTQRTLAIGDIHGGYRSLLQVLERSNFDYEKDKLVCLGDIADGWNEVPECVDELLKIKNLVAVCGNHDKWCIDWFRNGSAPIIWLMQGGTETIDSYIKTGQLTDKKHKDFWSELDKKHYHIEDDRLFIHGGYNWKLPIDKQPRMKNSNHSSVYWDRYLWETAELFEKRKQSTDKMIKEWSENLPKFTEQYKEIFIGHSSTALTHPDMKPVKALNVYNLDTGGGWEGKLTIMDIDTKEYWQSDLASKLYPEIVKIN